LMLSIPGLHRCDGSCSPKLTLSSIPKVVSGPPEQCSGDKQHEREQAHEKSFVGIHQAYNPIKAGYSANNGMAALFVGFFTIPVAALFMRRWGLRIFVCWGLYCFLLVLGSAVGFVK